MRYPNGFSLMELMVVVAVIFILLAVAIPGMRAMIIHANETSAVASIRAINTAEASYQVTYGGYAESLGQLGGAEPCKKSAETACLLDESLAGGEKSGYRFVAVGGNASGGLNTSYLASAAPDVFDRTGKRIFCSTDRGVIRTDQNAGGSTMPPTAEQCTAFPALK
ncbi:MAG TPA: prepilin-type N-terminal cleavage/methylation domain-containing protein [Candidatus Sulfotelmatobacter sp.]|nr:prepilin-type N-terminal cleavage/methylation domain-containing protein [Candidatus Sulfotelmatobacter sp.]